VIILNVFVLSALLALPVPVTKPIERAFLENSPGGLAEVLTARGDIPVSLPEPLSIADQLSPDQVYLVFRRVFSVYRTTEFFVTPGLTTLPGRPGGILRARWSFRDQKTGRISPLRVFFFLSPEPLSTVPGRGAARSALRIVEIRGERL
jgi:hypothetical protein